MLFTNNKNKMNSINLNELKKSDTTYALIDCDSFYASCEQFHNPKFLNKPLVVWRENDIILAASYEAKRLWIKTWTPYWEAAPILKKNNWLVVPPNFHLYKYISDKLITYLKTVSPLVEQFSIDEAFIEVWDIPKSFNLTPEQFAHKLKLSIKQKIGIPVSIGVSKTKLLSKIFSDLAKPFWVYCELDEKDIEYTLSKLKLTDIPFIWSWYWERLKRACNTALDFKKLDSQTVDRKMGKAWLKLWLELNLVSNMSFALSQIPKSISRTYSFHPDFTDSKDILFNHLIKNFEKAFSEMITLDLWCKEIIVLFKDKQFNFYHCSHKFPFHITDKDIILKELKRMFEEIYYSNPNTLWRTTWVILSNLRNQFNQKSLFQISQDCISVPNYWLVYMKEDWIVVKKYKEIDKEYLYKTVNSINSKWGAGTITMASNLFADKKEKKLNIFWVVS